MNLKSLRLLSTVMLSAFFLAIFFIPGVSAQNCDNPANAQEAIQCGSSNTSGVPVSSNPENAINSVITDSLNILTVVVGIIAVVMIVYGGFRYVTSGGDATRVASAKNTLMYAIIGLIIAVLAQVIVKFVLKQATTDVSSGTPSNSQTPPNSNPTNPNTPPCTPGRPGIQC